MPLAWQVLPLPVMDIARPDIKKQKQRRLIIWAGIGVVVLTVAVVLVSRLKPAAPVVDASTVWPDTVKRGDMIRQVRGSTGTLAPREDSIELIPALTDATVVRIRVLPGHHRQARHGPDGPGSARGRAEVARCPIAGESRRGRLQGQAGDAAQHPDGQEDRGRASGD